VRFALGEHASEQQANDIAEDLAAVGFDRIRYWAMQEIDQHKDAPRQPTLRPIPLPPFLQGVWSEEPTAGVHRSEWTDYPPAKKTYVRIGWYLTAIFVGSPGFTPPYNPRYSKEIAPGIWVCCFTK
jgi:hypothetical protein